MFALNLSIKIEIQAGKESAVDFTTGQEPMVYKAKNGHLMVVSYEIINVCVTSDSGLIFSRKKRDATRIRLFVTPGFISGPDEVTGWAEEETHKKPVHISLGDPYGGSTCLRAYN